MSKKSPKTGAEGKVQKSLLPPELAERAQEAPNKPVVAVLSPAPENAAEFLAHMREKTIDAQELEGKIILKGGFALINEALEHPPVIILTAGKYLSLKFFFPGQSREEASSVASLDTQFIYHYESTNFVSKHSGGSSFLALESYLMSYEEQFPLASADGDEAGQKNSYSSFRSLDKRSDGGDSHDDTASSGWGRALPKIDAFDNWMQTHHDTLFVVPARNEGEQGENPGIGPLPSPEPAPDEPEQGGGGSSSPPVNGAPVLDTAESDQAVNSGAAFNLDVSGNFSDPDINVLTYTAQLNGGGALPGWLAFNGATGVFSGTPADGDAGAITIDVTADDGNGGTVTDTFQIRVNRIPTVTAIVNHSIAATVAFALDASTSFADADLDALSYTVQLNGGGALPGWLAFNGATGIFSGTPAGGDAGTITVDITADDGNGGTVTDTFDITITAYGTVGTAGADALAGNSVYGDAGNDTITGTGAADLLNGGPGDDTFNGQGSDDTIYGGDGNDNMQGVSGNDVLYGGAGTDTVDGGSGNDTLYGGADGDVFIAAAGTDLIYGEDGNDTVDAGDNNDTVYGGAGDDMLEGKRQDDLIYGEDGNDTVDGGRENDTLYGGDGSDTYIAGDDNDILVMDDDTSDGDTDHITDFMDDGIDKIAFLDSIYIFATNDGAKASVALTDDVDIFDTAGFAGGNFTAGATITFLYNTNNGEIWYDADGQNGAGNAVLVATIDNWAAYVYNAADFIGW